MAQQKRKMTTKERAFGIARVVSIAFKASPLSFFMRLFGAIITAGLPIITTYYAALTTTALADAYAGNEAAGQQAIIYVLITAALGVVMAAWSSLEQYINNFVRYKVDAAISDQMYEHFLSLEFWRYEDKKTADLFDKAQQFARFFGYVFDSLSLIATAIFSLLFGLIALTLVSWWLGLILVVAVIPGIILQLRLSRLQQEHWRKNVDTRRKMHRIEWDVLTIDKVAEIRLYGLVRSILSLRRKLRDTDEKQQIQFERQFIGKQLLANTFEAAAEVAALIYTTLQIIAQAQPIGQFLYVQQITSRALAGARQFSTQLNSIDTDIANLFDYNEFMGLETASSRRTGLRRLPSRIELKNVSFSYVHSEQKVLEDVSLTINRGQHVAIVGENGAGKSTLVKLILGLYNPTQGKIEIDGVNLADMRLEDWHRHVSVLQQHHAPFSFATVRENVEYGDVSTKKRSRERFERATDEAESTAFIKKLPKADDTYVSTWMEHADGTQGVELSGGQQQRLSLARSFYRDSPIMILDEPTSAIDALAESRIFKRLFDRKDRTIITVSHRLTTVKRADWVIVIDEGKIVEQGTHAELVKKKGAYFTLFESQL